VKTREDALAFVRGISATGDTENTEKKIGNQKSAI